MYKVVVEYDGCTNWEPATPVVGTEEECVAFIERHLPPKGCEFGLINLETGRMASFMYTPARRRLPVRVVDIRY